MANVIQLKGVAKWARVREPDPDYDVYKIDLYMDDESFAKFKASGSQWRPRKDNDGLEFVTLKRKNNELDFRETPPKLTEAGPPEIYLLDKPSGEYVKWNEGFIGNGSKVVAVIEVFDTRNGKGSRLLRVFVEDLVEYTPQPKVSPEQTKLPF